MWSCLTHFPTLVSRVWSTWLFLSLMQDDHERYWKPHPQMSWRDIRQFAPNTKRLIVASPCPVLWGLRVSPSLPAATSIIKVHSSQQTTPAASLTACYPPPAPVPHSGSVVLSREDLAPRRHLTVSGGILVGIKGVGVLLIPSVLRPGMLLNMLQCTRQSPEQGIIWSRMSVVKKPYLAEKQTLNKNFSTSSCLRGDPMMPQYGSGKLTGKRRNP